MKHRTIILLLALTALFTVAPMQKSHAFIWEVIKQGIKKVIKAMDLQVQRMQNKTITLQNVQKRLENTMSRLKLKDISEWAEKQRRQYDDYFQELRKVKTAISTYQRMRDVFKRQAALVDEYKRYYQLIRSDRHFSPEEIRVMYRVYSGILEESVKNIDQVLLVAGAFSTQMSDAKRLEILNAAADRIEGNLGDLRAFNNQNIQLSIQRARDQTELGVVKAYYGLP